MIGENLPEPRVWNLKPIIGYYKHFFNDEANRNAAVAQCVSLGKGFVKQWVRDNPDELKDIDRLKKCLVFSPTKPKESQGTQPGTSGTQKE